MNWAALSRISKKSTNYTLCGGVRWSTEDYLAAHHRVVNSGRFNFESYMIPIPKSIRYDQLEEALGEHVTPKEQRFLKMLKFGIPIDCKQGFGVKKLKKNHYSALCNKDSISDYLSRSAETQAMLGPFNNPPLPDLCFSPLMTVPKEVSKRRVIVDFSFPPGSSINDGIPHSTFLECSVEFNLPSVQSMVSRVNELGKGCLLYKRDLKGAFRQFSSETTLIIFRQNGPFCLIAFVKKCHPKPNTDILKDLRIFSPCDNGPG